MPQPAGQLLIEEPGKPPRRVPLESPGLIIGRQPGTMRLVLDDPAVVAPQHARLRVDPRGVTLLNKGPGTRVNNTEIDPEASWQIEPGDVITIGGSRLTYEQLSTPAMSEQPPPAAISTSRNGQQRPRFPEDPKTPTQILDRPRAPIDPPELPDRISRYLRYLPAIFQGGDQLGISFDTSDGSFLGRYLLIFETIWERLEQRQNFIDMYFDPGTSPAAFIPWLASWLGMELDIPLPEERQRQLAAEAFELYRWRGTSYGLQRMIKLCTGVEPEIVNLRDEDSSAQECVFRVIMRPPPNGIIDRDLVKRLVEAHKPAHAGYILDLEVSP
jgi:phage tail-like protein